MRRVGVTPRLDRYQGKREEIRAGVDIRLLEWLRVLECEPVPLAFQDAPQNIVDAVLFSGGNDLPEVNPSPLNQMRGEFELNWLRFAFQKRIPLLGLCRGAQMLGCELGMKLVEVDQPIGENHEIHWLKENTFSMKNSYHKWGFREASSKIMVIAQTKKDHTIEAFCSMDRLAWGWMWHPEREDRFDREDIEKGRLILRGKMA